MLPRGLHRHFYNTFKKAAVFNFIGADYDAIPNRRPSDLDFYVIARLLDDPDAVFDDIINEYCSVYGKAADTVKAYYAGLAKRGEAALFATTEKMQKENLSVLDDGELGKYAISGHTEKDLAADINLLKEGLKKELSPAEKTRLNALIICAEHYLHSFRFMRAGANGKDIEKYGKTLHDFRIANKDVLNENFGVIYSRTEKSCWAQVEFYNKFVRKSNFKAADPCAGWRESFDGPGLAKWQPRKGYVKVTDKTASFDKYSVELKPNAAKGDTIGIWRRAVPVTPSGKYTLTFDFKFDGVSHGGIRVAANGAKRTTLLRVITKDNGSNFWQSTQKSFKVPADCTSIDMYVFIGKGSESSRAYIDNIQLTRK